MAKNQFTSPHGHKPKHGKPSPTYSSWQAMRNRCKNPNNPNFVDYGAKGISVASRWDDFRVFLADMGERPAGTTLDRIDGSKGYAPENCRWATTTEQSRNRHVVKEVLGETGAHTVGEWCEINGLSYGTAKDRIARGWNSLRAVTEPSRGRNQKGEKHPMAKLNDGMVRDIARRHQAGQSIRRIAEAMGLGRSAVQKVVCGDRWAHITGIIKTPHRRS